MTIFNFLLISLILLVIVKIIEPFFYKIFKYKESKIDIKKENNVEKIKILLEDKSIEKIDGFINNLINQAIEQYMIFNMTTKEHYINAKESETVIKYVYGTIKVNMTQNTRDVIGLIYDVSTDQKLENLLMIKIKINVLALLVDNNKVIQ